ncbi:MAG: hypothetical protein MUE99_07175 [Chitinophagaceae bacterium]|jgi:hypothetical protein|nr:hypothetical protein [Chitinophagaceae bacterium]
MNSSILNELFYIKALDEEGANALLELQVKGKIEILPDNEIPEWQKMESLRRLNFMKENPDEYISLADFRKAMYHQ